MVSPIKAVSENSHLIVFFLLTLDTDDTTILNMNILKAYCRNDSYNKHAKEVGYREGWCYIIISVLLHSEF
jgi:hypothetical protein